MEKFFVYIIYSAAKDRYYVGQTEDLEERLKSHLSHISPYTSMAGDWKLMYFEQFNSRLEAISKDRR